MQDRIEGRRDLSPYARAVVAVLIAAERATRGHGHRGYWHVAKWLGAGAREELAVVRVGDGTIQIRLADPYWARLVSTGYEYEPEVAWLISSVLDSETDFVDVGANIGYWSVWVSQRYPQSRVRAVEPNPSVFRDLCRNKERNGDRFEVLQAAVAVDERRGVPFHVPIGRGGHASAHLVADGVDPQGAEVVFVHARPLDEILEGVRKPGRKVLVKLDIEGMETAVLASSNAVSAPSVAVIYEDHGADRGCHPTAHLLAQEGRVVYLARPEKELVAINSILQLAAYKVNPKVGYNCVTVIRDSAWHRLLQPLCGSGQ